jgi:hypothetical protein
MKLSKNIFTIALLLVVGIALLLFYLIAIQQDNYEQRTEVHNGYPFTR